LRDELQKVKMHKAAGPEMLSRSTVWHHRIYVQPEPEPEPGESTTAVENLLCGTSAEDHTSEGPQQLLDGSTDLTFDEDPREVGPQTSLPPGKVLIGSAAGPLPAWHLGRCYVRIIFVDLYSAFNSIQPEFLGYKQEL
ncbi:hypothetical protein XENOCAPTIV_020829, partial [Xenoophorus captivus]